MNKYFLTGATGVVGNAIAQMLLAEPNNKVTLLIRAKSAEELNSRVQELLTFWQIDAASVKGRLEALAGDTTLPQFGLSPESFEGLADTCSHIVHCAALVRMNLPIEEARKSAVSAAQNVVHLAEHCQKKGRLKKVEFISTVGVGGRLPGMLPERWITETRTFHNTYEQAKAEAEAYIQQKVSDGLPITVHRPSMVVGDSQTGRIIRFQIFYHLVEFLIGRRTNGVFPSFGTTRLDIVPVDYVAAAVVWSSNSQETVGRILHLCAGPDGSIAIDKLQRRIRTQLITAGDKVPGLIKIPAGIFRAALPALKLFSPPELRRAIGTLPIFLEYLASDQSFSNELTRPLLHQKGIELPPVDAYLIKVLTPYLRPDKNNQSSSAKR